MLAVADRVEIAYFLEATRRPLEGEFDVALVEGSVSTPEQEEEIRDIRRRSRFLITLGACASHGGIQGLRNFGSLNVEQALAIVYASPQYIETLAHSRPASDYVAVDLELPGCPINKHQLLGVLGQMLAGSRPKVPNHALCLDCKRQHLVCVLVAHGAPAWGRSRPPAAACSARATIARAIVASGQTPSPTRRRWPGGSSNWGSSPRRSGGSSSFYANAPHSRRQGNAMSNQLPIIG